MTGDGESNQALQTILVSGDAGDGVTFRALSSADAVPESSGKYLVELTLIHRDGSKQRTTLRFSPGTHGPEEVSKTLVATEAFSHLKVRTEYGRASGIVRFDEVSVVLD
ncbi:MAG: hypothetical protein FJ148_07605 [Deltaproteobacteria bacterium]|nr:hypothetical protein [Deltaproteobacteria bacterium]